MKPLSFAVILAAAPALLSAQQSPRNTAIPPLEIGAVAPDFSLKGATRYGALANPVHLSDFKGKTVVLAFFYRREAAAERSRWTRTVISTRSSSRTAAAWC